MGCVLGNVHNNQAIVSSTLNIKVQSMLLKVYCDFRSTKKDLVLMNILIESGLEAQHSSFSTSSQMKLMLLVHESRP